MEHLDLAGVISTPTIWSLSPFDQQDAVYLSSSRQMLEPILEETSEDEEHAQNSWNQYEHATSFWSSAESETGSVIRVEVNKDSDAISERDFACPAKRARRSADEFLIGGPTATQVPSTVSQQSAAASVDDTVLLRRYQRNVDYNDINNSNSLERFLAYEACARDSWGAGNQLQRSSTGSRRFDDYSDSDSLSYNSLSRSSSLIQFESLERQLQLQEQHASMSSLGNSSPSLLSFDGAHANADDSANRSGANSGSNSGNNSRRGSQSSLLKRFESSDGRLHQTYIDLDKLNFDDEQQRRVLFGSATGKTNIIEATIGEVKSDSESSTSSAGSTGSGNSILTASKPSAEDLTDSSSAVSARTARCMAFQRVGKSSAENLSEDSGYCEPSTLRRAKSKSIPKNFEKFCEEEEEFQREPVEVDSAQNTHSKNSNGGGVIPCEMRDVDAAHDICQPKINANEVKSKRATNESVSNVPLAAAPPSPPLAPLTCSAPASPPASSTTSASPPPYYERVKNSPESSATTLLEHRRSMAHSPSPVSSDASSGSSASTRSSTSASTCASAASFTWLPIQRQRQPAEQRTRIESKQQTLDDFCASLRNSSPDIRDAYGTTDTAAAYYSQANERAVNGYGLEHPAESTTTTATAITPGSRVSQELAADDSDISTSSASAHDSRSDETDYVESTPETRKKRSVGSSGGADSGGDSREPARYTNRGGRNASVPNELHKLGRKKRPAKLKYSKSSSEDERASTSDDSSAAAAGEECDFFDDDSSLRIRRSCSWSERRERNLQRFESVFGGGERTREDSSSRRLFTQSLGYMNASYQNLTLLDYSGHEEQTAGSAANCKRASGNMDARKASGDYESLICKGNFLLDELSEIYDKNASILNDRPAEDESAAATESEPLTRQCFEVPEFADAASCSPRPPARQRKHSNSSYSDLDNASDDVQHVQLTIRKPPARQRHGRKAAEANASNSLVLEGATSGAKTFDQDPTNLHTNYAQSLEKCNFDAKELCNSESAKPASIPKRRFQSQTASNNKQRNLVSSTPNLHAYDARAEEIEDDIYVSSAHTSMHQLPQGTAPKPLGILLPAGSRTSFGKEVSFCPVVSKYSWQEQSSEECNEPQQLQRQNATCGDTHIEADEEETDDDDELLDNADATVIYNTKENELIAARYKEEQLQRERNNKEQMANKEQNQMKEHDAIVTQLRENPLPNEKVRALLVVRVREQDQPQSKNAHERKTSHEVDEQSEKAQKRVSSGTPEQPNSAEVSYTSTIVDDRTQQVSTCATQRNNNVTTPIPSVATSNGQQKQARPLSIQLPILSEPPTNRAHHILYASQQMLDNLQRREREEQLRGERSNSGESALVSAAGPRSQSVNNLSEHKKRDRFAMSSGSGADAVAAAGSNNNNDMLKSKFKDEKHPSSKGFLSRFAHGFRFSLRRNKKKQQQQQQQQQQKEQQQLSVEQQNGGAINVGKPSKADKANKTTAGVSKEKATKTGSRAVNAATTNGNSSASTHNVSSTSTASQQSGGGTIFAKVGAKNDTSSPDTTPKVTGKPPLPKQPPRAATLPNNAAVTNSQQQQQQQRAGVAMAANFNALQAPQHQHQHQHRQQRQLGNSQFYDDFLDAERSYYYDDFKNQLNSGIAANVCEARAVSANADDTRLSNAASEMLVTGNGRLPAANASSVIANAYVQHNNRSKIGLIETDLDTHETVISGKTRSLMDIVVGPASASASASASSSMQHHGLNKRLTMTGGIGGVGGARSNDIDAAVDDDYDDDVEHMNAGGVMVKTQPGGAQIASVRRPHKSMEFLLDKENQKNIAPPENELQKSHENNPAALSEHQLRIQASLQRLNIPEWFRQYNKTSPDGSGASGGYKPGNFTRKRTTESGRWAGLNSKTTSLSSLGSQRSDRSPLLLSPSAHSHHGGQTAAAGAHHQHQHVAGTGAYGTGGPGAFSRWSTSHLNSSQTSPSVSQRGSFTRGGPVNSSFMSVASGNSSVIRNSFRQPYLGWRSTEKLSQRTPHERLANSLLAQQQRTSPTQRTANGKLQPVTPEIQSSIKEVTSAIVHYVNDQTNQQRSRSTSPNSRKCWLESSFVGIRPLDSPQTPVIDNSSGAFSAAATVSSNPSSSNYNNSYNYNNSNQSSAAYLNNNSSATSSILSNNTLTATPVAGTAATITSLNTNVIRMNGLSIGGGGESTIYI